jgi:hypothetical protein
VLNKKEVNTKKNKLVQAKHELISPVLKNNLFRPKLSDFLRRNVPRS